MKRLLWIGCLILGSSGLYSGPAHALKYEEGSDAPTRTIEDFIKDYVDIPQGGLDWKMLGKTKVLDITTKDADGMDLFYQKPVFPESVKKLDQTQIKIKGYMFPLDPDEKQGQFLFGPFPLNCPFQYHVSPALVIEAHTVKNTPIKFSYDPLTIEGTLELVPEDKDLSTFYRLKDVKLIKD
ncbi:MAG: DUF3299 domain-containing protein [Alphaproteobacteria bacterium]|nr:DUF3299 domain-containing protein [Alphaproteobacteria bacterium]